MNKVVKIRHWSGALHDTRFRFLPSSVQPPPARRLAMESTGGGVLTVRTERERANVLIEFSDTGPGLAEPERVFDPFYTTKAIGKGSGLGLSICYGIIQEHGGSITGFNRVDGGATFRIELPAVLALLPQLAPVTSSAGHSR